MDVKCTRSTGDGRAKSIRVEFMGIPNIRRGYQPGIGCEMDYTRKARAFQLRLNCAKGSEPWHRDPYRERWTAHHSEQFH